MVLLYLSESQKDKIGILNQYDASIIAEFCKIALEFIYKDINNKMLNSAAQKLELQSKDLKELIELTMWILIESSKLNLNEKEIKESLTLVGLRPELIEEIYSHVKANMVPIQNYLETLKLSTIEYKNLEWRIDFKLASRAIRKCVEPEILLKLDLTDSNRQTQTHILQTDIINLNHLTNCLEEALNELRTNYARRVFKNIV